MSKAIQGAAILGAAGILGAFTLGVGGVVLEAAMNTAMGFQLLAGVALAGVSMEAGAIADALTSNRGMTITTRQPAANRQVIYGLQRVGGVLVYSSTTGSTHNQYNRVIVLAGHVSDSITDLYLDGRKVFWDAGSGGHSTRNGYGFGGTASSEGHVGPGGQYYDFGGIVYCEARYGDQSLGDVILGLTANDPVWAASGGNSPFLGGCTYVYLKIVHDDMMFPSEPEIRFTVRGKCDIYDPRTGTRGWSNNWALIVNDVLCGEEFGVGSDYATEIKEDVLIAAANVCDEQVPLAAGGTESRYACNWHFDTASAPGDLLATMMTAAAGRLSRIGGEWHIWPAFWQGPSCYFGPDDFTGPIEWTPKKAFRDRFNRVNGTYTAANYPYNTVGNLYDSNGWYDGSLANTFPFGFQPSSYPQYACDTLHGYASDQYLDEDGGIELPKEISQACVLSVTQAQRVAKIYLLRNRHEGVGKFLMSLAAWQEQPQDVMLVDFPALGWDAKQLEIVGTSLEITEGSAEGDGPSIRVTHTVAETSASVFDWSITEELTVYDVPADPQQTPYIVAPPTDMTLVASAATAIHGLDGIVYPRIEVEWTEPSDSLVRNVQVQYRHSGDSAWIDAATAGVSSTLMFIGGVIAGEYYDVRIRSLRASGASSVWVEINGFQVALTLSILTDSPMAQAALTGLAYADGTAGIAVAAFQARVGRASVICLPTGYTITGLLQNTLYYVFYVDGTFAGGAITPIATRNVADFRAKVGYFQIGSIVTPVTGGGTGGGFTGPTVNAVLRILYHLDGVHYVVDGIAIDVSGSHYTYASYASGGSGGANAFDVDFTINLTLDSNGAIIGASASGGSGIYFDPPSSLSLTR